MLDTHAAHGQGDLFLRAFLAACRPPIELALPERYHIQTEPAGLESIVDIVLYEAGVFLIYIENKTVSEAGWRNTTASFATCAALVLLWEFYPKLSTRSF